MPAKSSDPGQLWAAALGQLQMQVTKPNFETWLKHTSGLAYKGGEFIVGTPNAFVAEMLEQRMYSLIAQTVEGVVEDEVEVRFEVESSFVDEDATDPEGSTEDEPFSPPHPPPVNSGGHVPSLNSKYTFKNFVVGESNRLAHAAAEAVASDPGHVYNPLVIYSDVGLGKTHLMHAIGHEVALKGMSLIYSTTEEFTNAYIRSIREGTTDEFRDYYRNEDVLLLDDIQFLIGKEQTQEGFFHTFNALHMTNRQIVLTSDRPVRSFKSIIEDRVESRLSGGLVVDIHPPDIETRVAILKTKLEGNGHHYPIEDELVFFLAELVHKNVRELEGTLHRVIALSNMRGEPANVDMVLRAVENEEVVSVSTRKLPADVVIGAVAGYYEVDVERLKGRRRDKRTSLARQTAMYLLREESQFGLATIGQLMGGKDHTTVKHGCDRILNMINVNPSVRRDVMKIREELDALQ